MNNFGYMNIKTNLLERSKRILNKVVNSRNNGKFASGWKREGFSTIQDWAKKEISLIDWELETRKRYFNNE